MTAAVVPERRVLLTVSGTIPGGLDAEVAAGKRPRTDYRVIAERLGADVVSVDQALAATGRSGRAMQRLGGNGVLLAWYAFRHRREYDVVVTDGEHVGIPWEVLTRLFGRRGSKHLMVAHIVSVPKKAMLLRRARLARRIEGYLVYCEFQADFLRDDLGVPTSRITVSPFMVDSHFFDPAAHRVERRHMICSAGLERRDYPTLVEAVDGLDVDVVIAAASPWSRRADSSADIDLPPNVSVTRLDLSELRVLYAAAAFVVMPLEPVDFQAGVTTVLEAMSMERAVVCSSVAGQTGAIIDGETAVLVPQGDAAELRRVIEHLLASPDEAARIGNNGRSWVLAHADIDRYADDIEVAVDGVMSGD